MKASPGGEAGLRRSEKCEGQRIEARPQNTGAIRNAGVSGSCCYLGEERRTTSQAHQDGTPPWSTQGLEGGTAAIVPEGRSRRHCHRPACRWAAGARARNVCSCRFRQARQFFYHHPPKSDGREGCSAISSDALFSPS